MLIKVVFFEDAAQRQFERELPQILLTHAHALNADALPDLLTVLRIRGYEFISMAAAVQDPAYAHDDQFFGRGGISWLHRWALTDKMPMSHYANGYLVELATDVHCDAQEFVITSSKKSKTPGITRRNVYLGSHGLTAGIIHGGRSG